MDYIEEIYGCEEGLRHFVSLAYRAFEQRVREKDKVKFSSLPLSRRKTAIARHMPEFMHDLVFWLVRNQNWDLEIDEIYDSGKADWSLAQLFEFLLIKDLESGERDLPSHEVREILASALSRIGSLQDATEETEMDDTAPTMRLKSVPKDLSLDAIQGVPVEWFRDEVAKFDTVSWRNGSDHLGEFSARSILGRLRNMPEGSDVVVVVKPTGGGRSFRTGTSLGGGDSSLTIETNFQYC